MSNVNDQEYLRYLQRLSARYRANTEGRPVYRTNMNKDKTWQKYLACFAEQQYHNCFACRSFIGRYAGLVTIDANGVTKSALWDVHDAGNDRELQAATKALGLLAEMAEVSGIFYNNESVLGKPVTNAVWRHFNVENPAIFSSVRIGAPQAENEKRQEHTNLVRALREFKPAAVAAAVRLLKSGALFRAERVIDRAEWFMELQGRIGAPQNMVWNVVASAPPGFANVRSSMFGPLVKDIQAGMPTSTVTERFNKKMDSYMKSEAEPSAAQIDSAERAVDALGIAPAFNRRYLTASDVEFEPGVLWQPAKEMPSLQTVPARAAKSSGIFDALRKQPAEPEIDTNLPAKPITLEKFLANVVPTAARIQYRAPLMARFAALTVADGRDTPVILQWDSAERRNSVSWNFSQPASAQDFNLQPGALVDVKYIISAPNMWDPAKPQPHHGKGAFLLLDGAKDTRGLPGGGLFVEHLRSELRPYRRTIETHMNKLTVAGADDAIGFGIGLLDGNDWSESAAAVVAAPTGAKVAAPDRVHVILVVDDSGSMQGYLAAARQAFDHMLKSTKEMPGIVDYTIVRFGTNVYVDFTTVSYDRVNGFTRNMNARSGNTSLNDAIGEAVELSGPMYHAKGTAFFLGIVTDGEENHSQTYTTKDVRAAIQRVLSTGDWTVAFAGAGYNAVPYATAIGVPPGNIKRFEASARGFEDVGTAYAAGTAQLARGYKTGKRATDSFFSAVSGRETIGKDLPVLLVTTKAGLQTAYKLDRYA